MGVDVFTLAGVAAAPEGRPRLRLDDVEADEVLRAGDLEGVRLGVLAGDLDADFLGLLVRDVGVCFLTVDRERELLRLRDPVDLAIAVVQELLAEC